MRKFSMLFLIVMMSQTNTFSSNEISARGVPMTYRIQRKSVRGYVISDASVYKTREDLRNLLKTWELKENQIEFMIDFYIHTGYAESCYVMDSSVFSIEKQVNGKALGFIQIMPDTATAVIDEVFESRNPEYIEKMERICFESFDCSLKELKAKIKDNTTSLLNNHKISMFIFYLKFSNRKWKDIPNFLENEIDNSLQAHARIWKKVWNTYLGKGTVNRYIVQVHECNKKI